MFCSKCGSSVEDGAAFCPVCGSPVQAPATLPVPVVEAEVLEADDAKEFTDSQRKYIIKLMAILCYTGIAVLLPIFLLKDKKYLRKHANNGLVLLILQAASATIAWIPVFGWLTGVPVACFLTVLSVIGIIHAAKGQSFQMPIIGNWFKILK